jgi:adenylate cyclase
VPYEENLVARVRNGGEAVRRRLVGAQARLDFPILHDVKAQGGTEYFGFPVASAYGTHMVSYTTDRLGGFSEEEIAQLRAVSERLSVLADTHIQRQIAENVLKAYLGPQTGPLVLAGKIRRGTGDTINAVLWSSDVRSFTAFSDRVPGQQVIAKLDQIFDGQARAIAKHGGEILKFIGDGLLAIFPVDTPDQAALAAAEALTAATEALESVQALGPHCPGEAPFKMVIALHYGSAIYGNIGAADRLDFTVIGPDVNLVSRIEAVAKSLDLPLLVSDDFARAYGGSLRSLGQHKLRGLEQPHELFTV